MSAPILSIVIPVYNVEDYLAECLDSVLSQTYSDFEAICVNDGSTDASAQILNAYSQRDSRIKMIEKENGGLSSARNAGIDAARGDIVCFLDSDDSLVPDAASIIVRELEASGADVLTFGAIPYPKRDDADFTYMEMILSPRCVAYESFDPAVLFQENSHPYVWRSACRLAFLNEAGLRFDETLRFGEDEAFYFSLYPRAQRISLIEDKLILYRANRGGSLMRKKTDRTWKVGAHLEIVDRVLRDWCSAGLCERHGDLILKWSAEFILNDLFRLDDAECCRHAAKLKALWDECIPCASVERFSHDPVYGEMSVAVSSGFGLQGFSKKKILAKFVRASLGTREMLRQLGGIAR